MPRTVKLLDQSELKRILSYDPETGAFTWRETLSNRAPAGSVAGSLDDRGYVKVMVGGKLYKAHRLAWLYMTGAWPTAKVDHRDTDKGNNRWANLRLANKQQNAANSKTPITNTTGFKGVTLNKNTNAFDAQIKVNGKHIYLGARATAEDAHQLYVLAAKKHFGEFARFQ